MMQRTVVQSARMRIADLEVGDVVNGHPEEEFGWFEVQTIRQLPSGEIVANGRSSAQAVKGSPYDLIGVQFTKVVEVKQPAPAQAATAN